MLPALRLCLLRRIGEVMLAVTDPSDEAPAPKAPTADGESGRGLQIVGALSYVWGWSPIEGNGKAVWAVLQRPRLRRLAGTRRNVRVRRLTHRNVRQLRSDLWFIERHRLIGHRKHVLDQGDQDFLRRLP